jgi:hypothetical protein
VRLQTPRELATIAGSPGHALGLGEVVEKQILWENAARMFGG